MEDGTTHKKYTLDLPNTERVSEKILDYYLKYGKERDLKKFMRLYSPNEHCDQNDSSGSSVSDEQYIGVERFVDTTPNKETSGPLTKSDQPEAEASTELIIPIELIDTKFHAVSCENIPSPSPIYRQIRVQTPESVIKSRKRLEWDSLGDVGYKKSKSTSNISQMERSILKELFNSTAKNNSSDTQLVSTTKNINNDKQVMNKNKKMENKQLGLEKVENTKGNKIHSNRESIRSSVYKKKLLDKSVQTSSAMCLPYRNASNNSFQSTSSLPCETVTPSSFDVYSSQVTQYKNETAGTKLNQEMSSADHLNQMEAMEEPMNFINEISSYKSENKNSASLSHPQIDLGIQLLCSLIEAKNLTSKEKLKLVKEIIKRISQIMKSNMDEKSSEVISTDNSNAKEDSNDADQLIEKTKHMSLQEISSENLKNLNENVANADSTKIPEWLVPITNSEIMYEQQKKEFAKDVKKKILKCELQKLRVERNIRLECIEKEIHRLNNVRELLLQNTSSSKLSNHENESSSTESSATYSTESTNSENLYDTVCSENSIVSTELVKKIQKNNKSNKSSDVKMKNKESADNFENVKSYEPSDVKNRLKIDTPVPSKECESVMSYQLERKKEFTEKYKKKREQQFKENMWKNKIPNHDTDSSSNASIYQNINHYSLPTKKYFPIGQENVLRNVNRVNYFPLLKQKRKPERNNEKKSLTPSVAISTSEISVPMGSYNETSTSTQYDQLSVERLSAGVTENYNEIRTRFQFQRVKSNNIKLSKKPLSYTITFNDSTVPKNVSYSSEQQLTLEGHLKKKRPEFCAHLEERQTVLHQMHMLRQERERELRKLIEDSSISSLDRKINNLPPPPIKQIRIFSTNEMKSRTRKHFSKLPEVRERQQRALEQRHRQGNQKLRDIFNQRLQKCVRLGQLSLNHSKTLV